MTPNTKSQSPPAPGILGNGPPPVWQILGSRILGLWRSGRGLWTTSPRPPPPHLIWSCIWEREKQVTKEGPTRERYIHKKMPSCKNNFLNTHPNPKLHILFTATLGNMVPPHTGFRLMNILPACGSVCEWSRSPFLSLISSWDFCICSRRQATSQLESKD